MSQPTIFLSFASEDLEFAQALATAVETLNIGVWFAPGQLQAGDSIVEKINNAMSSASFALLIISRSFLAKDWPRREFHALCALMVKDPGKRLIPILHGVSDQDFVKEAPMMADIKWLSSERGLDWIVSNLRIFFKEQSDNEIPRQQAVLEQGGKITRYDTLIQALEAAQENGMIILYPGNYVAPRRITKSISIVARGLARETTVQVTKGSTLRVESRSLEIDGVSLMQAPSETEPTTAEADYALFECSCPRPRIYRGEALIAVCRNSILGRILFKNCILDGRNKLKYLLATDSRVEIRNSKLLHSEYGLTVRLGGDLQIVGCNLDSTVGEATHRANLVFVKSAAMNSNFVARDFASISVSNSEFINSSVHGYSNSKIFVSNNSKFSHQSHAKTMEQYLVYATHFCFIRLEDSSFEGGSISIYAYGGTLMSARRVTVRGAEYRGVKYSEGCSGDLDECRVFDCAKNGIQVQKGANPKIQKCIVEGNGGVGIASVMSGNLTITDCHIQANRSGGVTSEGGEVKITNTRIFLNDGPGIQVSSETRLELVGCEVGQNVNGQLMIGKFQWYPPETIKHRLDDFFRRRTNIKLKNTTLY